MCRKCAAALVPSALSLMVVLFLAACGNAPAPPGDGVIVAFSFMDSVTGEGVEGVEMFLNGSTRSTDRNGKITLSTEEDALPVEGYAVPDSLIAMEYMSGKEKTCYYVKFTATRSFEMCTYLTQPGAPVYEIPIEVGDTNDQVLESAQYDVTVYTADGREVGWKGGSENTAEICEGVSGNLLFFVRDYGAAGSDYFALVEGIVDPPDPANVGTAAEALYQVRYPETSFTLSGHASGAEVVWAVPVLGQTPLFDHSFSDEPDEDGSFTIEVPKEGPVYFKLGMEDGIGPKEKDGTSPKKKKDTVKKKKEVITKPPPEAKRYMIHPDRFTAGASGLSLVFAENPGMPDTWESKAEIAPSTGVCSWSPAGNACFYHLKVNYPGKLVKINQVPDVPTTVYGLVEGSSVTFPGSIDLSDTHPSTIVPVWSEGVIAVPGTDFIVTPYGEAAGTLIYYDYLEAEMDNTDPR